MKFVDEYRDPALARKLVAEIAAAATRPWVIMEICGGHTHAIIRHGLDQLLPPQIELVHGPGCPVCVTPAALIDQAIQLACRPEIIFTSFGDMLRVPGAIAQQHRTFGRAAGLEYTGYEAPGCLPKSAALLNDCRSPEQSPTGPNERLLPVSLQQARAAGGDVRMVYSPLEAVELARRYPERQVVFFAVGFETTAPGNAMAVLQAARLGLPNFSLLVSHVLVPPAIAALLAAPDNRVQAFLAAGHVCTVMGWEEYEPLVARHRVPMVPAGFEPVDILAAILMLVRQLEAGRAEVENEYTRSVRRQGNPAAQRAVEQVFQVVDRDWRGLGVIPASGLALRPEFAEFDAERKFAAAGAGAGAAPGSVAGLAATGGAASGSVAAASSAAGNGLVAAQDAGDNLCLSGAILRGVKKPPQCPAFASRCTPENPLGATMVSNEGACNAYYQARGRFAPW